MSGQSSWRKRARRAIRARLRGSPARKNSAGVNWFEPKAIALGAAPIRSRKGIPAAAVNLNPRVEQNSKLRFRVSLRAQFPLQGGHLLLLLGLLRPQVAQLRHLRLIGSGFLLRGCIGPLVRLLIRPPGLQPFRNLRGAIEKRLPRVFDAVHSTGNHLACVPMRRIQKIKLRAVLVNCQLPPLLRETEKNALGIGKTFCRDGQVLLQRLLRLLLPEPASVFLDRLIRLISQLGQ